jgi:glycosyltransferase involved in cell wall biosynthesis
MNELLASTDVRRSVKTIISTGPGRLHFVELACALQDAGEDIRIVTGWIPGPRGERLADLVGPLIGRPNLAKRLRPRQANGRIARERMHTMPFAEGLASLGHRLWGLGVLPHGPTMRLAWQNFGRATRRYLHDADIFHVRSAAGQGGAIATAKRRGMKVVVDQSIAHPAFIDRALAPDFADIGERQWLSMRDGFCRLMVEDCEQADCVLVNSGFVKETFVSEGFPAEKIHVEYLGVRPDFFGLKQDWSICGPVKILFTGGFGIRKGAAHFLAALHLLYKRGIRYEATVVGSVEEIAKMPAANPLPANLRFVPRVPQDELKQFLASHDLYLFPTLAEGCANSAMEALAAGIPVITTRECGLPARHGEQVWLIPPRDPGAICDAIEMLISDSSQREALGLSAIGFMRGTYLWERFGSQVRRLHESLQATGANKR